MSQFTENVLKLLIPLEVVCLFSFIISHLSLLFFIMNMHFEGSFGFSVSLYYVFAISFIAFVINFNLIMLKTKKFK